MRCVMLSNDFVISSSHLSLFAVIRFFSQSVVKATPAVCVRRTFASMMLIGRHVRSLPGFDTGCARRGGIAVEYCTDWDKAYFWKVNSTSRRRVSHEK